jgi:hypothetical protein
MQVPMRIGVKSRGQTGMEPNRRACNPFPRSNPHNHAAVKRQSIAQIPADAGRLERFGRVKHASPAPL